MKSITKLAGLGGWISIADRQPIEGQLVLFSDAGSECIGIGFYLVEDRNLWLEAGVYWMPAPMPPTTPTDA